MQNWLLQKIKGLLDMIYKISKNKKEKEVIQQTQEIVSNQKVWIDPDTSLMWQVDVNGEEYIRDEAFEYAKSLNTEKYGGYDDWRVPDIDELYSIRTFELNKCSNGENYFIKKPLVESMSSFTSDFFWSSTDIEEVSNGAWNVEFLNGYNFANFKAFSYYVRCVRNGR